jgi:hypothetical protein
VPEREPVAALDQHPGVDELLHRLEQRRRQPVEHLGQVGKREPAAERRGHRDGLARRLGHAAQTLSHREADAAGQARLDQLGLTGDDAYEVLVPEPGQQLHEQEGAAAGALDQVEEGVVGLGVHDVLGDLRDGGVVERSEDDPVRAVAGEMLDRGEELRRALVGAKGDDPGHGKGGQADRQRAQRRRGPAVSPLLVVERDQERAAERRALEHRLQVLQQPVALLRQRVKVVQPGSLEQRIRAVEQRGHERGELDDPGVGLGRAGADPEREAARDAPRLSQQAGLAHSGLPLDEHHRARPGAHTVQLNTDRREFGVAAANDGSGGDRLAQISESTALVTAGFRPPQRTTMRYRAGMFPWTPMTTIRSRIKEIRDSSRGQTTRRSPAISPSSRIGGRLCRVLAS